VRRLTFFLAAVSLVLSAPKALCYATTSPFARDTFNSFKYDEIREDGPISRSIRRGRFLSVDPVIGNPEQPRSWNRYAYVMNSPIGHVDPTGKIMDGDLNNAIKYVAQALGFHWWNDSKARLVYNTAKKDLVKGADGANTARTEAKVGSRAVSTPAGASIAETMRPLKDEAGRLGGTPSGGNAAVDAAFVSRAGRAAGPILAATGVAISAANVATAPPGQKYRTLAGESGGLLGAVSFGEGGAWAGAAAGAGIGAWFGGAGAVPGAIIGGIIGMGSGAVAGGSLGEKAGHNVYDATVPDQQ
jgi:general stress protein YciG